MVEHEQRAITPLLRGASRGTSGLPWGAPGAPGTKSVRHQDPVGIQAERFGDATCEHRSQSREPQVGFSWNSSPIALFDR